ncbi:MAG TPA: hypothetical protein VF916_09500, partial [Ktedonobacterales bacterium]
MDEDLLHDLPDEYAALGDPRTVMLEVTAQLKELHAAVTRLGDALESAGLPGRDWRLAEAHLRLLPGSLPNITVDDFVTRLAEFSADNGPQRLHSNHHDLELFHKEVAAIHGVVQRLQRIAYDLDDMPPRDRRSARISRAFGDARVREALDDIEQILGDFIALRPFMAPLARHEWEGSAARLSQADRSSQADGSPVGRRRGVRETLPMLSSKPHARLRDFAPANNGNGALGRLSARVRRLIAELRRRIARLRVASSARKQLVAIAIVAVLGLSGIGLVVVLSRAPADSSPAGRAPGSTPTAAATETPHRSAAPPKLALTCAAQGSTATLTIKNEGASAVTWQAQASSRLRVSPDHGSLASGQSATAQVSTNRQQVTGTITVTATNSARSAQFSVSCGGG